MKNIDFKFLDKRTVRRYLEQGLVKQEDYQKYLHSLSDDAGDATAVNFFEIDQASDPVSPTPLAKPDWATTTE